MANLSLEAFRWRFPLLGKRVYLNTCEQGGLDFSLSPKDDAVAATTVDQKGAVQDLGVVETATGRVTAVASGASRPSWGPGGTSITYESRGNLYQVQVGSSAPGRLLIQNASLASWNPAGVRFAYWSGDGDLYIEDLTSNTRRILSRVRGLLAAPRWSPDGAVILVVHDIGFVRTWMSAFDCLGFQAYDESLIDVETGRSETLATRCTPFPQFIDWVNSPALCGVQ